MGTTESPEGDGGYTFRYAPDDPFEPVSTICHGVAWVTGAGVTDLEPLARVVDPDVLIDQYREDELLASSGDRLRSSPTMTFEYHGCLVTVESETVSVAWRDDAS